MNISASGGSLPIQSAPNATYQVRPGEILGDQNGAHVKSVWTERFDDGDETYEIVWALRRQQDGWRLAGMAMELIPGQPMQYLNFEDPADMLRCTVLMGSQSSSSGEHRQSQHFAITNARGKNCAAERSFLYPCTDSRSAEE